MAEVAKLIAEHGGEVPRDRDALEALPGAGRKTANVVLNVIFGEPTMAVDTHVFRVARRTGLSSGDTPPAVEEDLRRGLPAKDGTQAPHRVIMDGAGPGRGRGGVTTTAATGPGRQARHRTTVSSPEEGGPTRVARR